MPPLPYTYSVPDLTGCETEERIGLAIKAINDSPILPDGRHQLSIRQAAKDFNVVRSTLAARFGGVGTRQQAHEHERKLSPAEEKVLVAWIKAQGQRGVPVLPTMLAEHAASIAGGPVGASWPGRFMERHPDLKTKWTQSLEKCRASNVNYATVNNFFNIYEELVTKYSVPAENIYNMDEKGLQLGVGKRVAAIIDRDQKNVYNLEDGNRELVTVIETVCADGTALNPSVIFKGAKTNLEWGRVNPCHASISHSPNGWTDQELGSKWLGRDFEPQTAARNVSKGYRLLILDGHNSHCTYTFCKIAEDHKIIIVCLPSHTTHVLQPCDVGVFGPLASCWKSEVNTASGQYISITKTNLIQHYSRARDKAFKEATIRKAFLKTGLWPMNRHILDPIVFAPALNTTTLPAQPLSAPEAPVILSSSHMSTRLSVNSMVTSTDTATTSATSKTDNSGSPSTSSTANLTPGILHPTHFVLEIPKLLPHSAAWSILYQQNIELFVIIKTMKERIHADYAQLRLMDDENGKLRQQLYNKANKKKDKRNSSEARHMTSTEVLELLAKLDWQSKINDLFKEAKDIFKEREKAIANHYKDIAEEEKQEKGREKQRAAEAKKAAAEAEKQATREAGEAERQAKKTAVEAEKRVKKVVAEAQKLETNWMKEMAGLVKYAADEVKKAAKEPKNQVEKATKTARIQEKRKRGQELKGDEDLQQTPSGKTRRRRKVVALSESDDHSNDLEYSSTPALDKTPVPTRPRPRPRPIPRKIQPPSYPPATPARASNSTRNPATPGSILKYATLTLPATPNSRTRRGVVFATTPLEGPSSPGNPLESPTRHRQRGYNLRAISEEEGEELTVPPSPTRRSARSGNLLLKPLPPLRYSLRSRR